VLNCGQIPVASAAECQVQALTPFFAGLALFHFQIFVPARAIRLLPKQTPPGALQARPCSRPRADWAARRSLHPKCRSPAVAQRSILRFDTSIFDGADPRSKYHRKQSLQVASTNAGCHVDSSCSEAAAEAPPVTATVGRLVAGHIVHTHGRRRGGNSATTITTTYGRPYGTEYAALASLWMSCRYASSSNPLWRTCLYTRLCTNPAACRAVQHSGSQFTALSARK
jgi:hypothetical protein